MKTAEKQTSFSTPPLQVKKTGRKGHGVFASAPIAAGSLVVHLSGFVLPTHKLRADYMALQIDSDMWLCSRGGRLDDMINHSCRPNTGFTGGGLKLFALLDIAAGEEITFDYSTSLTDEAWSLNCLCGEKACRKTILPFQHNGPAYMQKHLSLALDYIRKLYATSHRSTHARQA